MPKRPRQRLCSRRCAAARGSRRNVERIAERDPDGYKVIYRNGYRMRYVRHLTGKWGYRYEHRLVMEEHLGRPLLPTEVVHHKNHDRHDNRIANLELMSGHSEHRKSHPELGWQKGDPKPWQRKPEVPCPVCGTWFKPRRRTLPNGERSDTATCSFSCGQRFRHWDD